MLDLLIRGLFAARYVTFGAVLILLVALAASGKRVSYEQSIGSFFAADDPYMAVYQNAAKTFGDDNFIFLVYDDPDLVTPAGLERVSELAAAVAPQRIDAVQRVESLDAMPLLWAVDDALFALDSLPRIARNMALSAAKRAIKNIDLKTNTLTVAGAVRASAADPKALDAIKDTAHDASAVSRYADRLDRDDDGGRRAAQENATTQRDRDRGDASQDGR